MATDNRRNWLAKTVTKMFGLNSTNYFEEMVSNNEELEDALTSYLDDDLIKTTDFHKSLFYVYKTSYEKLVEEEIMVPEIGTLFTNKISVKFNFYLKIAFKFGFRHVYLFFMAFYSAKTS